MSSQTIAKKINSGTNNIVVILLYRITLIRIQLYNTG